MSDSVHDVVIVGSGVAGLTAALAAAKAGLAPLVIEKSDRIGGVTGWSYGALWVACSAQARSAGIDDSLEDAAIYLGFLSGGEAVAERSSALLHHAPRILAELDQAGVKFGLIEGVGDIMYGKAPGAAQQGRTLEPLSMRGAELGALRASLNTPPGDDWWRLQRSVVMQLPGPDAVQAALRDAVAADQLAQGPAIIARLLLALTARGVRVRLNTAADSLLVQDGRVIGVRCGGATLRATSGVLIAAGNYLANARLVAALDKIPDYQPYFPPTSSGDSLFLAAGVGGSIRTTRNNLVFMLGFDDPDGAELQAGAPSTRELPRAHTIVVNNAGVRFGNEVSFQELAPSLRDMDWNTRKPRNLPCWMITDHSYVARWGIAGSAPGTVPGFVHSASTLSALAATAGIDPDGLVATVARVNGFVETGIDEDFERKPGWAMVAGFGSGKNPSLGAIATPPFYAVRLRPTLGAAGSGVAADAQGCVLDWRDQPIPGLYCAGDAALHDEFGAGYQAGVTYAAAMTFAWLAVEDMAAKTVSSSG